MTFSTLIIGVAFLPLFTMTGVSGVIFAPMARTYAFAIGGAILLALTLTPVLAVAVHARADRGEGERRSCASSTASTTRSSTPRCAGPKRARRSCGSSRSSPASRSSRCSGGEFMPKLEEGNFWIRATLADVDLARAVVELRRRACATSSAAAQDEPIPCTDENRTHPEVVTVVSQLGRPDDGTDVSGFYNIEFFAPLEAVRRVAARADQGQAHRRAQRRARSDAFPGVVFNFSQYITDNVEEALAGREGRELGQGLRPRPRGERARAPSRSSTSWRTCAGWRTSASSTRSASPTSRSRPTARACARYGLNTGDVDAVVQAAIGGQAVTQVYEGEKHFDLTVRWLPEYRDVARGDPRDHRRHARRQPRSRSASSPTIDEDDGPGDRSTARTARATRR